MSTKRSNRHNPGEIVRNLRNANAIFNAGKDLAAVFQTLEISERPLAHRRNEYGGMKAEEAK